MSRPELAPTELEVMKVLWAEGRLAAREVHERLPASLGWAASTTRTVLDRMVGKGLVEKVPFHGLNLYRPAISRAAGLAPLVRDFAARVLEMDAQPVVSLFAESGALAPEELAELERLVESGDGGDGGEDAEDAS